MSRVGRQSRAGHGAAALGVVLLAATVASCGGEPATPTGSAFPHANLIVISLDTLRADALGSGGGPADISPFLDSLADECVVFEHARATAPHTAPSHMSLFTSVYPSVHGVQNVVQGIDPRLKGTPRADERVAIIYPLPASIPTLAEVLKGQGFTTLGLTDGGNLMPAHGFTRGFDLYTKDLTGMAAQIHDAELWLEHKRRPAPMPDGRSQIADSLAPVSGPHLSRLVQARFGEEPAERYFLFWHTYEVHAPYVPPAAYIDTWAPGDYDGPMRSVVEGLEGLSFRETWSRMKTEFWSERDRFGADEARFLEGLYHGGVRFADDTMPALWSALERSGALDDSIVVILSDHGEEFFEHGKWQHEQVYEECLRVPLMVRLPGGRNGGTRIRTPVGLMDVMPTLLELLDVEAVAPDGTELALQGRSLADAVLTGREPTELPVTSEYMANHPGNPIHEWEVAHHFQGLKFIQDRVRGKLVDGEPVYDHYLYDLGTDADEQTDLVAGGHPRTAFFRTHDEGFRKINEARAKGRSVNPGDLDPDTCNQLVQLGYIEGPCPEN